MGVATVVRDGTCRIVVLGVCVLVGMLAVLIVGILVRIVGVRVMLLLAMSETVAEIMSESVTVSLHRTRARVRGRHEVGRKTGGRKEKKKKKKKTKDPTLRVHGRLSTMYGVGGNGYDQTVESWLRCNQTIKISRYRGTQDEAERNWGTKEGTMGDTRKKLGQVRKYGDAGARAMQNFTGPRRKERGNEPSWRMPAPDRPGRRGVSGVPSGPSQPTGPSTSAQLAVVIGSRVSLRLRTAC